MIFIDILFGVLFYIVIGLWTYWLALLRNSKGKPFHGEYDVKTNFSFYFIMLAWWSFWVVHIFAVLLRILSLRDVKERLWEQFK